MKDKISQGKIGERLAADFLEKHGYVILEKNYRHGRGEIDLIVSKNNCLIFVEVKLRSSTAFGFPEQFVSATKAKKVMETAAHYISAKDWQHAVRYDIISIVKQPNSLDIQHFEDAFY